jgi:hypothetical protein
MPLSWMDVHLLHGWDLNQARVTVSAIPRSGPVRHREILRHSTHLQTDLGWDPSYAVDSPL